MASFRPFVTLFYASALALGACATSDEPAAAGAEADEASTAQSALELDPNPFCTDQTYTESWWQACGPGVYEHCTKTCITNYDLVWGPPTPTNPTGRTCEKGVTLCGPGKCGECGPNQ